MVLYMKINHTLLHAGQFAVFLGELLSLKVVRNSTGYCGIPQGTVEFHISKWNTGEKSCLMSHFHFKQPWRMWPVWKVDQTLTAVLIILCVALLHFTLFAMYFRNGSLDPGVTTEKAKTGFFVYVFLLFISCEKIEELEISSNFFQRACC